jgi:hypothetical protein
MDQDQVEALAVNLSTPFIARLLGWISSTLLGAAGISITVPGDAPEKIALALVGLVGILAHQYMANRSNTKIAQAGYIQGAASVGATVLPSEVPKVVNAPAPSVPVIPPQPSLKPTIDQAGNVSISPTNPTTYK